MSIKRLQDRKLNPTRIGTYSLRKHVLKFHKVSIDKSGKCDAHYTGLDTDVVEGVVFYIDSEDIEHLDDFEGCGKKYKNGYRKEEGVQVLGNTDGEQLEVFTYFAMKTKHDAPPPYTWYKEHVLIGAREAGLSVEYIAKIKAVDARKDPKPCREQKELEIYRC